MLAPPVVVGAPLPLWARALEQRQFSVQEGVYGFFDGTTCKSTSHCWQINPLTPYGLAYLPAHPQEAATEVDYQNSFQALGLCKGNLCPVWRIAKGEAVVIVGTTPPEATYWSFSPSLFSRYHERGFMPHPSLQHIYLSCKPALLKGNRCEVFASTQDPVNMNTMNISGGNSPFQREFALVMTWDSIAEQTAMQALSAAGQANVNSQRFPGAIGKLGVTTGKEDEWTSLLRTEGFVNDADRQAFLANARMRVFRVTPPGSDNVPESALFPSFEGRMRNRFVGVGESVADVSFAQLSAALRDLVGQVRKVQTDAFGSSKRDVRSLQFPALVKDSGYECLHSGSHCLGDCRDTIYAKATFFVDAKICNKTHAPCPRAWDATLSDEQGDEYFVVGVNHHATNWSIYSSVTAYNYPRDSSVTPAITNDRYAGSAVKYLGNTTVAKYLYVVKFARHCSGLDLCVEIPQKQTSDPNVNPLGIDETITFTERMYLHPLTNSGPAVNETILPTLIHFKPKHHSVEASDVTSIVV